MQQEPKHNNNKDNAKQKAFVSQGFVMESDGIL